ncbi:MAG: DUF4157 domain-containing protein [Anaerolineae bacterium]|nr:DUF4157 domain-containing protein [Anaerolineae bacterium]
MKTPQSHKKDSSHEVMNAPKTSERLPQAHDVERIPSELTLQQAIDYPHRATPKDILGLQSVYGNRTTSHFIQTKLRVGPVGDTYEQEADRVADQVVHTPKPDAASPVQRQEMPEDEELLQGKPLAATITPVVQRQEDEELLQGKPLLQRQAELEEEEELVQPKPLLQRQEDEELLQGKSLLQRQVEPEEEEELVQPKPLLQRQEDEELLQGKPLLQRQAEEEEELIQPKALAQRQELEEEDLQLKPMVARSGSQANDDIERRIAVNRGGGSPLPDHLRADMETRFGNDFSTVRVHTGGEAEQLNRDLSARAFTHGSDIYMGSSQYNPDSTDGQRLLAHELTHVVQQTGHRAKNTHTTSTDTPPRTAQRANIIQRAVTDSKWADLFPKEKQTLIKSGFFDDAGLEQDPPGHGNARNWNALNPNERSAYYEKSQAKVTLSGAEGIVPDTTLFRELTTEEKEAVSAIIPVSPRVGSPNRPAGNGWLPGDVLNENARKIVLKAKAYSKLSVAQKAALTETYGISNSTEYAQIPNNRVVEIQKLLEEAKTKEGQEKEKGLRKTEEEGLKEKPGFWEMAGEGWRGFGTTLERGTRSLLGLGMSSDTAKRRIYARRRQQILRDRLARGEMPMRQRPLRARPAPSVSRPSSEDIKNIMEAVKAIQSSTLRNKNDVVRALLEKAGM